MSYRRAVELLRAELGELLEEQTKAVDLAAYLAYDGRPVEFMREVLRFAPWSRQEEVALTLERHPLLAVVGANSVGKDALLAHYALYWTLARGGLALLVAPTDRQNREILFREIRSAWQRVRGGLPGRLLTHAYEPGGGSEGGILAMTSTAVSKLTGFHAEKVLFVLSEAQDLEPFVLEAALSCATGPEDRIVQAGNPLFPTGAFFDAAIGDTWATVTIPAFEHPNVVEGRTVISGGPSKEGIDRMRSQFGEDSNTFRSRVLSEFPTQDAEGLIDREWIEAAIERYEGGVLKGEGDPVASLDVARYGGDGNVLMIRHGPVVVHVEKWGGLSTLNTARRVDSVVGRFRIRPRPVAPALPPKRGTIVADVVGLGTGCVEALGEMGYDVVEHNGGEFGSGRFLNKRAESYWHLRDRLSPDRADIAFPRDPELIEELLAIRWREGSGGKVQLVEKSEVRARIGRSPDKADALAMLFRPVRRPAEPFLWRV